MKLELKDLAQYLPYELRYANTKNDKIYTMKSISTEINMVDFGWGDAMEIKEVKPILRPLSDLNKEIEVNGERFVPIDIMNEYSDLECVPSLLSDNPDALYFSNNEDKIYLTDIYPNHISKLFEWHFDVFNLIENNLAIDINTLK